MYVFFSPHLNKDFHVHFHLNIYILAALIEHMQLVEEFFFFYWNQIRCPTIVLLSRKEK